MGGRIFFASRHVSVPPTRGGRERLFIAGWRLVLLGMKNSRPPRLLEMGEGVFFFF